MNKELHSSNKSGSTRRNVLGMGLALTATSALSRTGAAQDGSGRTGNTLRKSLDPVGRRRLGRLEVSAVGLDVQNMSRNPWIVPIPGTTQMAHMLDNSGAEAVRFTPAELGELNSAVRAV